VVPFCRAVDRFFLLQEFVEVDGVPGFTSGDTKCATQLINGEHMTVSKPITFLDGNVTTTVRAPRSGTPRYSVSYPDALCAVLCCSG
jgi:hypothetical protein